MLVRNFGFLKALYYQWITEDRLSDYVYLTNLSKELFSNNSKEKMLLYYSDDVKNFINQENAATINDKFNELQEVLDKKNISLVLLPCVDKWDLYYQYIEEKTSPENPLFAELKELPKKYIFINSK